MNKGRFLRCFPALAVPDYYPSFLLRFSPGPCSHIGRGGRQDSSVGAIKDPKGYVLIPRNSWYSKDVSFPDKGMGRPGRSVWSGEWHKPGGRGDGGGCVRLPLRITWDQLKSEPLSQKGPPAPARPTCSRVRRRNSWDSSSGCSSSSESVQLRPPTSPAIVVARRPRPATHKAPRRKRPGSDAPAGPWVWRHCWCARRTAPPLWWRAGMLG